MIDQNPFGIKGMQQFKATKARDLDVSIKNKLSEFEW